MNGAQKLLSLFYNTCYKVQDLPKLWDNFYNFILANKKEQTFEFLKEVEKNIDKIPAEFKEELRFNFVNLSKTFLSRDHKITEFDEFILSMFKQSNFYSKANPEIIVTKADKINSTVITNRNYYHIVFQNFCARG